MKKALYSLLIVFGPSSAQTAYEVIKRADEHLRGVSNKAEMTIEIQRPKWTRTMEIKAWNWQPKIEKVIKLPASMMMQPWMGSDLTNDDLVKESSILNDYTHQIVGDTIIQERACYSIELTPKAEAAVVWGLIKTFIGKKDYLQLGSEFYDEDGYLITTMEASDIRYFGTKILPATIVMTPIEEKGKKTTIHYRSIEFNIDIQKEFFSKQNMKRLN
jgi:outer membrane lipoprotein-sorting protein